MKSKRCEGWQNCKTNEKFRNPIRSKFSYKTYLSSESVLEKLRDGSIYGYIQCDLVVPDELKTKFANFPPIFKRLKWEELISGSICQIMPLKMIFLNTPSER